MVMVPDGNGQMYSLDGFLYNSFSDAKKVMEKKDVDLVVLITGYPGCGKSTISMQLATFLDPTFNEERMCQSAEKFIEEIKKAKKRQAIVLDESFEDLNASDVRKEVGRVLRNILNIIRQKNLYLFIILPNFFDLGKSIAIFRSRWLIHCYDKSFGDIGYFTAFDRSTKQKLYVYGRKNEDYNCVKADFFGSFSAYIPSQLDYEKYLKEKAKALHNIKFEGGNTTKFQKERDIAIVKLRNIYNFKTEEIAQLFEVTERTIYNVIRRDKEKKEFAEQVREKFKEEAQKPQIKKRFSGKVRK